MDKESNHMKATFKVVPKGVLKRLAKITSSTEDNSKIRVNEWYPDHTMALTKVGIKMFFFNLG